jgi:hypothetical protein
MGNKLFLAKNLIIYYTQETRYCWWNFLINYYTLRIFCFNENFKWYGEHIVVDKKFKWINIHEEQIVSDNKNLQLTIIHGEQGICWW